MGVRETFLARLASLNEARFLGGFCSHGFEV